MTFARFIKISFILLAALLIAAITFFFLWYRSGNLQKTVVSEIGKRFLLIDGNNLPPESEDGSLVISPAVGANFVQKFFGLEEPRTYLILFLNNTELRPGGGFIGTYAVVKMVNANPEIIKVEGTEILDNLAPTNFASEPPAPIKEYLGVERWYFRDSNWSPDFTTAAVKSLELYKKQKGAGAEEIDTVIAFTPTVIEGLLRIIGPIEVNGVQFTADNFIEKMNYEVEFGFEQRGISFDERKSMLLEMTKIVIHNTAKNIFKHWNDYKTLVEKMLIEKQVVMYSTYLDSQAVLEAKNWAGKMSGVNYDYLLWADANLGALKTDASIKRSLSYEIYQNNEGRWIGRAKMTLQHKGVFDWRTTRYRDYARVFVPMGSELIRGIGVMKTDRSSEAGPVSKGIENGRQWFGGFISVEPGKTGEIAFEYYLASEVVDRIKANNYRLLVQKQIGTNDTRLTLDLNFANKLVFAMPVERPDKFGDNRYNYNAVLLKDIDFEVRTQ